MQKNIRTNPDKVETVIRQNPGFFAPISADMFPVKGSVDSTDYLAWQNAFQKLVEAYNQQADYTDYERNRLLSTIDSIRALPVRDCEQEARELRNLSAADKKTIQDLQGKIGALQKQIKSTPPVKETVPDQAMIKALTDQLFAAQSMVNKLQEDNEVFRNNEAKRSSQKFGVWVSFWWLIALAVIIAGVFIIRSAIKLKTVNIKS